MNPNTRRSALRIVSLAAMLTATPTAIAQWSADPAVNLTVADRPAGQVQPKLVPTADGGLYVSWFGGLADGFDVYLQRLDSRGVPQWDDDGVRVADRAYSWTQDYGLALGPTGDALLAFDFDDAGAQAQAIANRVTPAAVFPWGQPGVFASTNGASSPRVAAVPGGGGVVGWATSSSVEGIVLQMLDANGAPRWGPEGVSIPTGWDTFFLADLLADTDGNVIAGWADRIRLSPWTMRARKLAGADGATLWSALVFEGTNALSVSPLVPDGSGGAVFAWWYRVSFGEAARVRVQRVRADGTLAFPQNGVEVATTPGLARSAPAAAFDSTTGDVYVVWAEETTAAPTPATPRLFGVSAQRVDASGVRRWGDGGRPLVALGGEQTSQVQALQLPGGPLFAWSLGSAPNPMRIESARLDPNGAYVWSPGVAAVKTAPTAHRRTQAALSTTGYAAFVWAEGATGGEVVKAQNINADGTLGNTSTASEPGAGESALILDIGPNPARGHVRVRYAVRAPSQMRLAVYDALGRELAVIAEGVRVGEHEATLQAGRLAPGMYLLRLEAGGAVVTRRLMVAR